MPKNKWNELNERLLAVRWDTVCFKHIASNKEHELLTRERKGVLPGFVHIVLLNQLITVLFKQ